MSNDDMVFNGPAEFDMQVFIINEDTGQSGKATIGLGAFEYPTPQKVKARLDKLNAEDFQGALEGFRLMTKIEAWEAVILEKTGERFAMIGGREWDPIAGDSMQAAFNNAINFTLSHEADGEGLAFLELWREGCWPEISDQFPEFVTKYGLPE